MSFGDIVNQELALSGATIHFGVAPTFLPTAGNAIIVVTSHRNGLSGLVSPPAGWTKLVELGTPGGSGFSDGLTIWGKDSDGTEIGPYIIGGATTYHHVFEIEGAGIIDAGVDQDEGTSTAISCGTVTPPSSPGFILGAAVNNGDAGTTRTPGAGYTELADYNNGEFHPQTGIVSKLATVASTPTMTIATGGARSWWAGAIALGPSEPIVTEPPPADVVAFPYIRGTAWVEPE